MQVAIGSAHWAVSRALAPVTDGLFELWAASSELGPNACELKRELLCARAMLENARGHGDDVRNPALEELLLELRQHAYRADEVLDELEYFRIQDQLEGTNETIDNTSDRGFVGGLVFNTRHTAKAVASKLKLSCSCASATWDGSDGDQEDAKYEQDEVQQPKLKFDRVQMSKRMKQILEQLKSLRTNVASIIPELRQLSPNPSTTRLIDRQKTTPDIIEPKLYGRRDHMKRNIIENFTNDTYSANYLTVLSIVGPGGLGKTTFIQHIYEDVKDQFHVPIWICVSFDFNANRLAQEIVKQIPKVKDENENASEGELIRRRLQYKKFLLLLDDMWESPEDEWKKLLAPFTKGGTRGNMVIVTTRIPKIAKMVASKDCLIRLERLNNEECMHFFLACVFDDQKSWEGHANLKNVGWEIVKRLKGSPLAVKTVGRLLRDNLDPDYWNRVLESREWQHQTNDDDIMPALRLSYNRLPFHLQHCFSYCSLFPEDYEFDSKELIHFWIGQGLLGTSDQNKRIEDVGEDYLNGLVNYGFLQKNFRGDAHPYYLVHDLLHELAKDVSSHECLSIHGSNAPSSKDLASIRHLSMIVDNAYVKDKMAFETYKSDLVMLGTRLKVENLHSLILFGSHHGSFLKTFSNLFREAKALRVIFLSGASYNVECLVPNFSKLVHLRYLRIKGDEHSQSASIPSSIPRFYHLLVLDLKSCSYNIDCLREMSNLVKIRHLLDPYDEIHSRIFEVGKMKSLQELRSFMVRKNSPGFELKQLGQLLKLHGSLVIRNLERVQDIEEAIESRLAHINYLNQLALHWDTERWTHQNPEKEQAVLESLKPHSIRKISIKGHGGPTCPTWLRADLAINNLEHLCLQDVAWENLPPLGKLSMISEQDKGCPDHIPTQSFRNLKSLELVNIPTLRKWCGNSTFHLSSCLEVLIVRNCQHLVELPFSHCTSLHDEQVKSMTLFPKLQELDISYCPILLSVPRIPWTPNMCIANIEKVGSGFPDLSLFSKKELRVSGGKPWNLLCVDNLRELEVLSIINRPHLRLDQMQMLASLKHLTIEGCNILLRPIEGDRKARYQFLQMETLKIYKCDANGRELTQLVSYFPNLSRLELRHCAKVTGLGVAKKQTRSRTEDAKIGEWEHQWRWSQGLLFLPSKIETLKITCCANLSQQWSLHGLESLRSLYVESSPLCSVSASCSSSPFPDSLQELSLLSVEGVLNLAPTSNLTSLTIQRCALNGTGIWPLLSQDQLKELNIIATPDILFGTESSQMCEQDGSHSSRLNYLFTDDITEIAAMPICSSLTKLQFCLNYDIKCFTQEQEGALKKLTSLQELIIDSCNLRSLPAGLSELPSFKRLEITCCPYFGSLHKDGLPESLTELKVENCNAICLLQEGSLPSSLQTLYISCCSNFKSISKDGLPSSLRELIIRSCPAIRSLPMGTLPNSLVMLDVNDSRNNELKRQCRRLQGTIPIVRA